MTRHLSRSNPCALTSENMQLGRLVSFYEDLLLNRFGTQLLHWTSSIVCSERYIRRHYKIALFVFSFQFVVSTEVTRRPL
jgi:hypothetical protein